MSKNDSDNDMERELGAAEAALPETITPARPEKEMLPAWLIGLWAADRPDLDWSTPAATRASVYELFRRGGATTQAREV
jgi:hypothetical protein